MADDPADFHVGSASVEIVPDARGWDAKVEAAVGRTKVRIELAVDEARAKAQIDDAAKDRKSKIKADADTDAAKTKLDDTARDRVARIKVTAETKAASADIDRVARNREATVKVKADTSGLGWLATLLGVAGAGVVPLTAGAGAILSAASPLGAGALGAGLYAAAAKSQISSTNAIGSQLKTYQQQAQLATTAASRAHALQMYAIAYDKLNASQLAFLNGEKQLSGAWSKLTSGVNVFGPLNAGVSILTTVLPKLNPLLVITDDALTGVLKNVQHYVQGGSFDHLIANIDKFAGPGITLGAASLGHFAEGIAGLMTAFGPLGIRTLQGFDNLMADFGKWANNSSGEQQLVSYISTEGPKAVQTVGDLVTAIAHVAIAAAPWGGVVLTTLDDLLKLINAIPTDALSPVITGIAGVTIGLKAMKLVGGASVISDLLTTIAVKVPIAETGLMGVAGGIENISTRLATSKVNMGAFAAGVAGLAASSTSASGAVNILGDTASGALIGFGVGGPIGGAVGGLIGLVGGGLIAALGDSGKAFHAATADVQGWADAINQGLTASENFARQQLLNDLQKSGTLATAQKAGFSVPQIIQGGLSGSLDGQVGLRLSHAQLELQQIQAQYQAFMSANPFLAKAGDQQRADHFQAQVDALKNQIKLYTELQTQLQQFNTDAQAAAQQAWASKQITAEYASALNKLPVRVQTRIDAMNVQPSEQAVINLAAQYKATPKEVQTYLKALGINESIGEIRKLIAQAQSWERTYNASLHVTADTSQAVAAIKSVLTGGLGVALGFGAPTKKKAGGGMIAGPGTGTSDSIPALLSNGEFVMNAKSTETYRPLLEAMNARRFAGGGYVTPAQLAASLGALPPSSRKGRRGRGSRRASGGVKPLTSLQLSNARYAFTLSETMSSTSVDKAFHTFAATLEAHGQSVVKTFDKLKLAAERNVRTYAATDSALKALQTSAANAKSAAAGSFQHNPFGGSLTELITQLSADKNDATSMNAALKIAKSKGLSGDFAAQLAGSGNLALAQQLAGGSRSQIAMVQALFGSRNQADTALGNTAASFYAAQIAKDQKELRALTAELARLNRAAEQLPGAVERGVASGMRHQSTAIANRGRTG